MAIQVGGTTVIDSSRNFVNIAGLNGEWVALGTSVSLVGAQSSTLNLTTTGYGLYSTYCDYIKYRLVVTEAFTNCDNPTTFNAGKIIFSPTTTTGGEIIVYKMAYNETGWNWVGSGSGGYSSVPVTMSEYPVTIVMEWSMTNGYSNAGYGNAIMVSSTSNFQYIIPAGWGCYTLKATGSAYWGNIILSATYPYTFTSGSYKLYGLKR